MDDMNIPGMPTTPPAPSGDAPVSGGSDAPAPTPPAPGPMGGDTEDEGHEMPAPGAPAPMGGGDEPEPTMPTPPTGGMPGSEHTSDDSHSGGGMGGAM